MGKKIANKKSDSTAANLGFEANLWRIGDIAVYGQESNSTTRRLAMKIEYSEVVTICDHKVALLTRRIP